MARLEHWPSLLARFIETRIDMPFEWGGNDCCSFAASAVEVMTGERPPLPEYTGERDALRLIATRSLRERVSDVMGLGIHPAFAQRGDVGLLDLGGRETVAVCVGDTFAAPGVDGLLLVPRERALCAWTV